MRHVVRHKDSMIKEIELTCSPAEWLIIRDALLDRIEANSEAADVGIIQGILRAEQTYEPLDAYKLTLQAAIFALETRVAKGDTEYVSTYTDGREYHIPYDKALIVLERMEAPYESD